MPVQYKEAQGKECSEADCTQTGQKTATEWKHRCCVEGADFLTTGKQDIESWKVL